MTSPPIAPVAAGAGPILSSLGFAARPYAEGGVVELRYQLPDPSRSVDDVEVVIVGRRHRYPGRRRRGELPIRATTDELADGWTVSDGGPLRWDDEDRREEVVDEIRTVTSHQYRYAGDPRDRLLVRRVRSVSTLAGEPISVQVSVFDRSGLEPGDISYYTAFVGPNHLYSSLTQASAVTTGRGRFDLFGSLPTVHQRDDTERPSPRSVANRYAEWGQLQRFLETFSAHGDMLAGEVEAMADLHDPGRADARVLGSLANLVGWKLFTYTNEEDQRTEIGFSPHVYRSRGSLQTLADIINRLTGWETLVREYAADVIMTYDIDRVDRVGGRRVYLDGHVQARSEPPWIQGARVPRGSVDTTDLDAMFQLRIRSAEDTTAYTYDLGRRRPDGGYDETNDVRYNRRTVGVYIVPDVDTELFTVEQEWSRIRQILTDFVPAQVRLVFTVLPGLDHEDARLDITDAHRDRGVGFTREPYRGLDDEVTDTIAGVRWLITNETDDRSIDTTAVDLGPRSVHVGLDQDEE